MKGKTHEYPAHPSLWSTILWTTLALFCLCPDIPLAHAEGSSPDSSVGPSDIGKSLSHTMAEKREVNEIIRLVRDHRLPMAYRLARAYVDRHPRDLTGIYLKAYIEKKSNFLKQGQITLEQGLKIDPESLDLNILMAEILIDEGHRRKARRILKSIAKKHPGNALVRRDLLSTYSYSENRLPNQVPMDQHLFSLGEIQAPFAPEPLLPAILPSWEAGLSVLGIGYQGGAAFAGDAQIKTPMADNLQFLAGSTEYEGLSSGRPAGSANWTYGGFDTRLGRHLALLFEGGDSSLNRGGFYGHVLFESQSLTVDLQGMDNMIWGDFGQSIQLGGLESGGSLSAVLQITKRISAGLNGWLYDLSLENGATPYGFFHNTFGYMDFQLTQDPSLDLMAGYDDWTIDAKPSVAALVPEIMRQQYVMVALNAAKTYDNGLSLNGQIGGFNDFYNHVVSYDGVLGFRYPVSPRWSFFASGLYFGESTLYSGPSEEFTLGLNIYF